MYLMISNESFLDKIFDSLLPFRLPIERKEQNT